MAIVGLINEQEFYSQHYMDENFAQDISSWASGLEKKEKEAKFKAAEASSKKDCWRTPWSRLSASSVKFLRAFDEFDEIEDSAEKVKEAERITAALLDILDLPHQKREDLFAEDAIVPLFGELKSPENKPYLWIFNAISSVKQGNSEDSGYVEFLSQPVLPEQFAKPENAQFKEYTSNKNVSWRNLLSKHVFSLANSPRWVLLTSVDEWILIDRMKFDQQRVLRFDWRELLSRRSESAFKAVAYLLGSEAYAASGTESRLADLDEKSFKHAHGVSEDLKYALREAVELLGNEAAQQLKKLASDQKKSVYSGANEIDAAVLSDECLRYLYRLLFLFFVEARPDLQYVPMNDMHYVDGYSLEWLRDLEMIPLTSKEEQEGSFLHQSIQELFDFLGHGTKIQSSSNEELGFSQNEFCVRELQSSLFDDSKMKLLKKVTFTNKTLQRVIELMSLTLPRDIKTGKSSGKMKRRGRISYAHLGLNQLGAVYEALLSYRGFFAKEDLYEVKTAGESNPNVLNAAYFVTAEQLKEYDDDEKVFDRDENGNKKLRVYPKGTFIYRMAGRERENSASYYTPEVLTKCVVEESLEVLAEQQLKDLPDDKAKAERILKWRICEPAMGSAAFLNEAVNQVAELYMRHAMRVPGARELTQAEYAQELQKVKMFIADKNIYGVDLNPVAVELAEVSIWLNALSSDHYVPWFGLQLHCGNSLIGCRRNAFKVSELKRKNDKGKTVIDVTGASVYNFDFKPLPPGYIWQFLLPDPDMSAYSDKAIAQLEKENLKTLRDKVSKFNKLTDADLGVLELLSLQVESLWQSWAKKLADLELRTTDTYSIYGHEDQQREKIPYVKKQKLLNQSRYGDGTLESGEFARIKLVLDYWCALWGWPIKDAEKFPSREEWTRQIQVILNSTSQLEETEYVRSDLFEDYDFGKIEKAQSEVDPTKRRGNLGRVFPALAVVNETSERRKFLHWPLRFAQIFLTGKERERGFDLTLGNPPWKTVRWEARGILSEFNPIYSVREKQYNAKDIDDVIKGEKGVVEGETLFARNPDLYCGFLHEFEEVSSSSFFFKSSRLYAELENSSPNLFKAFLPLVWRNSSKEGVQGLLHPDTPYTETKATSIRKAIYPRLRRHLQFSNELKLFSDVDHHTEFSVNVYGEEHSTEEIDFISMNDLFIPSTIKASRLLARDQAEAQLPEMKEGRKTSDGKWNTASHPHRLFRLKHKDLVNVAKVFNDDENAPKLPSFFNSTLLDIAEKFGEASLRVSDVGNNNMVISRMWDESVAKKGGYIKALPGNETVFPNAAWEVILNGPHISMGDPLFKNPRNPCLNNLSWDLIDLNSISDDYLPRVKYLPGLDKKDYKEEIQGVPWDQNKKFTDFYRLVYRVLVGTDLERTLTSVITPPQFAYVNIIQGFAFRQNSDLLKVASVFTSLVGDFYVRLQKKTNLLPTLMLNIPLSNFSDSQRLSLYARILSLNCLTTYYKRLWEECWDENYQKETWSVSQEGIDANFFSSLTKDWSRTNALRSDLMRRQALLEIDVIVAQAFGFTLEELKTMYNFGFRVMKSYDKDTYYDRNGRIVFTSNSGGLSGAGLPLKKKKSDDIEYSVNGNVREDGVGFDDVKDMKAGGTVSKTFTDDTMAGGPKRVTITYEAPFFKMDREADYERAWAFFEKKHKSS